MSAGSVSGNMKTMNLLASNISSYEVTCIADLPQFPIVEDFLIERAKDLHIPPKILKQLLVVADEIFTNIVVHGYARKIEEESQIITIHLFFDTTKKILTLKFMDTGKIYNPLDTEEPDIHASLENRIVGGLGVFLVKKLMDSVEYTHKDGVNILTVQKKM